MNNTKWDELRLRMYHLKDLSPQWRTCDIENGYISDWDGDWFYHFRIGGYKTIEWVEIKIQTEEQELAVLKVIKEIHLPGVRNKNGFRIYGYLSDKKEIDYIDM